MDRRLVPFTLTKTVLKYDLKSRELEILSVFTYTKLPHENRFKKVPILNIYAIEWTTQMSKIFFNRIIR